VEELFSYWEELGKALYLEEQFLQEIFDQFPMDPAERLRIILRKWRDTTDHPSLATLDGILEQFGFKDGMDGRNSKEIIILLHKLSECHDKTLQCIPECCIRVF